MLSSQNNSMRHHHSQQLQVSSFQAPKTERNEQIMRIHMNHEQVKHQLAFMSPTVLYQKDFANGTYRITQPGRYILGENIVLCFPELFPSLSYTTTNSGTTITTTTTTAGATNAITATTASNNGTGTINNNSNNNSGTVAAALTSPFSGQSNALVTFRPDYDYAYTVWSALLRHDVLLLPGAIFSYYTPLDGCGLFFSYLMHELVVSKNKTWLFIDPMQCISSMTICQFLNHIIAKLYTPDVVAAFTAFVRPRLNAYLLSLSQERLSLPLSAWF
jgi:hypothetical protein